MVSQEGFKELGIGQKPRDQQAMSAPFGRPLMQHGEHYGAEYHPGELLMLSQGLYRVTAMESLSVMLHMGLQGVVASGSSGTSLTLNITQSAGGVESDTALNNGFTVPQGTQIHIGEQGFNNAVQIVELAADAECGRAVGSVTFTGGQTNGDTITVISTDGTSITYTANSTTADYPSNQFRAANQHQSAESFEDAVNHASGHAGKIRAKHNGSGVVKLVQLTAGTDGETTITESLTNGSASNFANGTPGQLVCTLTADTSLRSGWSAGEDATLMFLPAASLDSTDGTILLEKRFFGLLESPDNRKVIYDMVWGISNHPKFVAASGDITNTGISLFRANDLGSQVSLGYGANDRVVSFGGGHFATEDQTQIDRDTSETGKTYYDIGAARHGSSGYGYGIGSAFDGMTSPKVRVFQPQGHVRFTVDERVGKANTDGQAGWLTSNHTASSAPNPVYRLTTGSGGNDNSIPEFQLLHDVDEDLRDPHINITGWKFLLEEVTDNEVREMIRRSGRFKYKTVQDAGLRGAFSDGTTGPSSGWKELVEQQRGRRMSFDDYKRATESVTKQTLNQIYGAGAPQGGMGRTADPRAQHRRY
jgi:hypothetical protein